MRRENKTAPARITAGEANRNGATNTESGRGMGDDNEGGKPSARELDVIIITSNRRRNRAFWGVY